MGFLLGASVLLNLLLLTVTRVLTKEMREEIKKFKVNFRNLLEEVEDDYKVNGTEHKLYNSKAYNSIRGYLYK